MIGRGLKTMHYHRLGIGFAIATRLVWGQTSPAFEVASVKPWQPSAISSTQVPLRADDAQVAYNGVSAKILIQIAYKVAEWQVAGGPSWLGSDHFVVRATLPAGVTTADIPAMMQTLLAERFHLAVHRETKEVPVYNLRIAKGGAKLKPGETEEQWKGNAMKGGIFAGGMELHRLSMGGLAEILGGKTGRPVIDETGLKGEFDVSLRWAAEELSTGGDAGGAPSLFTALQEQLGLRLDAGRAPVETIVIDRLEKPGEN